MTFSKYYGELLLRGRKAVPTAEEAQQDFQRTLRVTSLVLMNW